MRKILRRMAKAAMARQGVDHVNKRMRLNWRQITKAYPVEKYTGMRMTPQYRGRKDNRECQRHMGGKLLFVYPMTFVGKSHNERRRERMATR